MSEDPSIPQSWLFWLSGRGFILGWVVLVIGLASVLLLAYFLDRRLDGIAGQVAYDPLERYEEPDLSAFAAGDVSLQGLNRRESVYVPIYSHIYYNGGRPCPLEATLTIRNTDVKHPIYVRSVEYYNTEGKLVKRFVDRMIRLAPLQSIDFVIFAKDTTGGVGANAIVNWVGPDSIDTPMIEAVMVGAAGPQGICFQSTGQVIRSEPSGER